jgi:Tfp pilus assembly protein PilO
VIAAWLPWRRLLAVWLPAVVVALATVALYGWQTSESVGRSAQLRDRRERLETEIARLAAARETVRSEREAVATAEREFARLDREVFRSLDERLTAIMRAVGDATRESGLRPDSFAYAAKEEKGLGQTRFSVTFAVDGQYQQIRQLLSRLQSSPEFLIVESIAFSGEADSTTQELGISVRISTFLGETDPELLRRLTGGLGGPVEAGE